MLDLSKNTIMEWNLRGRFTTPLVRSDTMRAAVVGLILSLMAVAAALMLLRL